MAGAGAQCTFVSYEHNAVIVSFGEDEDENCNDVWQRTKHAIVPKVQWYPQKLGIAKLGIFGKPLELLANKLVTYQNGGDQSVPNLIARMFSVQ